MSKLYELIDAIIEKLNASVKVTRQELTEEQKAQARANIGVGEGSDNDEEDVLQLLMDMDIVQPLADTNNVVYVDENNNLYVL